MFRTIICLTLICLIPIFGCEKDEKSLHTVKSKVKPVEKTEKSTKTNEKVSSKKIESEKNVENDEKDSNDINMDVLPPELDTPIVNGLRVNVFATKKKFKLDEPMNIYTVIRNKSDKIIKLTVDYFQSSQNTQEYCSFSYFIFSKQHNIPQGLASAWPAVTENNVSPNAVFCYVIDIQNVFNLNNLIGKFTLHVFLKDEIENNDEIIESNTIEFEVVE